ncbi:lipopolysaccharide biosynthesis protein [Bacillus sp. FJAT-42315]|uniref:lipopolysaccharide biosynthesis protein n=1 Tax=Bacillus sp. FJAT-42315 TaxID=2014077 RepID=UPI000C234131|nr:lipopolysaccharide biosynthesis protein [Bacillus sp. FJAT-42315]
MPNENQLKRKTIFGLLWSFMDMFMNQGVQIVVLMILARLLSPEHFGVIGMVLIFISISNAIIDSGFTQALVRETNTTQEDYSTVFFFQLLMAIVMCSLLNSLAPLISGFFHEEQLIPILRVLSFGLIIHSLGIIQRIILIKQINFRTQTKINLLSAVVASIVAISCAFLGFGVWSLVAQTLTLQMMQTALLWFSNKWMPSFVFSLQSFKRLFGFGSKLLISGIIDTIYNQVYAMIIGRMYSATRLGFYTNASKLSNVIVISATSALQRVTYPVLSSIQEEEERLSLGFQKIIRTSAYLMFPVMIGLMTIADTLIPLIFGEQWFESIIYFKLLCIAGMLYPLHAINLNMLQVKGRSDLFLILEIIKKVLITILIAISLFLSLGIIGLIGAAIVSSYLSFYLNAYFSAREISYSVMDQVKDVFPMLLISIGMGGIVYLLGSVLPDEPLLKLGAQISTGVVLYVAFSRMFKIKELAMIYEMIAPIVQAMVRKKPFSVLLKGKGR